MDEPAADELAWDCFDDVGQESLNNHVTTRADLFYMPGAWTGVGG